MTFCARDHLNQRQNRGEGKSQTEPWFTNFIVRFLYEIFFELCLCIMINIAFMDPDNEGIWYISLLMIISVVVIGPVAITLLLFCGEKGPQYRHTYERGSFLRSFWAIRPIAKEAKTKLAIEAEKRIDVDF